MGGHGVGRGRVASHTATSLPGVKTGSETSMLMKMLGLTGRCVLTVQADATPKAKRAVQKRKQERPRTIADWGKRLQPIGVSDPDFRWSKVSGVDRADF